MKFQMFRCVFTQIIVNDRQFRVQIGCFVETADYFILLKTGFLKDFMIRKEGYFCPCFPSFSKGWKQAVFQFNIRDAPLKVIVMNAAFS